MRCHREAPPLDLDRGCVEDQPQPASDEGLEFETPLRAGLLRRGFATAAIRGSARLLPILLGVMVVSDKRGV